MSISLPRTIHPAPKPGGSALLREAIEAHETKMADTADDRALVLVRLVLKVLGRPVDRLTYTPRHREPVAVVDGLLFRGEADDPYSLNGGWLVVRTRHNGWREVRSLEQLGEVAAREPLAIVEAR